MKSYNSHNVLKNREIYSSWKELIYLDPCNYLDYNLWLKIRWQVNKNPVCLEFIVTLLEQKSCMYFSTELSLTTIFKVFWCFSPTKYLTIFILKTFKNPFALLVECIWLSKNTGSTGVRPFCTFWCKNQLYRTLHYRVP